MAHYRGGRISISSQEIETQSLGLALELFFVIATVLVINVWFVVVVIGAKVAKCRNCSPLCRTVTT